MLARAASNLVEGLLLLMMVALCVDIFLGVFSRYVIRSTFTWYDEIARLLFVWIVFLGAAVGVRRGAHFRLHLLVDRFPPAPRRVAHVFGVLVLMGFGLPDDNLHAPNEKFHLPNFYRGIETVGRYLEMLGE